MKERAGSRNSEACRKPGCVQTPARRQCRVSAYRSPLSPAARVTSSMTAERPAPAPTGLTQATHMPVPEPITAASVGGMRRSVMHGPLTNSRYH